MARGKVGTTWQRNHPRDVSYLKPKKFQDYMTITEVSRAVGRDVSRIRKLERQGRLPAAQRVERGELSVRLWSPAQVDEIRRIFESLRPGRRPK